MSAQKVNFRVLSVLFVFILILAMVGSGSAHAASSGVLGMDAMMTVSTASFAIGMKFFFIKVRELVW